MRKRLILWLAAAAALSSLAAGALILVRRPARGTDLLRKLDLECENGGLFQFFWNTRGQQNTATLQALMREGLSEHAEVFKQAVQIFDAEKPRLEDDWKAFDTSRDLGIYAAAKARSGIATLDAAWQALPHLRT